MTEVVKKLPIPLRRITGLDGLRAVAVIAVIFYHLAPSWLPGGYVGVDIFFVISGFLITTLLLEEYKRRGTINLLAFWQRRARRLLPALLVVVGMVSSIALLIGGDILVGIGRQVLGALTFSTNWVEIIAGTNYFNVQMAQLFTHFWSLAVEEQFYVLWPGLLFGIVALPWLARWRYAGASVCLSLAVASAAMMALWYDGQNITRVYYGLDTHLFGLMIGAALAFWEYGRLSAVPFRRQATQPAFSFDWPRLVQFLGLVGLVGLATVMIAMKGDTPWPYMGGLALAACMTALVIMAAANRNSIVCWLLEAQWLKWIGARSYGMYLWHWPVFVLLGVIMPKMAYAPWVIGIATIAITIIASAVSYAYIEQPVRRFGLRGALRRGIVRKPIIITNAHTRWSVRPHPLLVGILLMITLTCTAVVIAPRQTQAETQVAAGQTAIKRAQEQSPTSTSVNLRPATGTAPIVVEPPKTPIAGSDITLVGDSVALASAPILLAHFPGIVVDAQISRSLRAGGFEDIAALETAGKLRRVVVISLGTNGYYGTGSLDTLMTQLGGREVIFVTSYAPREWIVPNNKDIEVIAAKHPNVRIARWDRAISAQPEGVGPDGIHPNSIGQTIYTACLQTVIADMNK